MRKHFVRAWLAIGIGIVGSGVAHAQTTVPLPDSSQTTTMTATVSEQATVVVPATVTFNVSNVGAITTSSAAATVTITQIVLSSATKQLKVSMQANAASFTPPVAGATTWSASDVSWLAPTWTNGTGAGGTLSNTAFTALGTCTADVTSCSTTGSLFFYLAAKNTVKRSGNHTLVVTWKFESI
jgi:hypothetical protein